MIEFALEADLRCRQALSGLFQLRGRGLELKSSAIQSGWRLESLDGSVEAAVTLEREPQSGAWIEELSVHALRDLSGFLMDWHSLPLGYEKENWLTLPALFYGDNCPQTTRSDYPKSMDIPWSFRADASSTPGLHFPGWERGWAGFLEDDRVHFERGFPQGRGWVEGHDDTVGVGWSLSPQGRALRITWPAQQAPRRFFNYEAMEGPVEPTQDLRAGDKFKIRLWHFATGAGKQAYFQPLKVMSRRGQPEGFRADMGLIYDTAGYFARCLSESHYLEGKGFSHRDDMDEIHSGWCGGFAAVEAGINWGEKSGDSRLFKQAEVMGDYLCANGLTSYGLFKSGNFYGDWKDSVPWGMSDGLHIRNAAEGCLFLSRLLRREAARGRERADWRRALLSNLKVVRGWMKPNGELPLQVEPRTGKPIDFDGATPGAWAGAMAAMGGDWLEDARKIGRFYLGNYVKQEKFYGGPYDTYKVPNMEDPYLLLIAYVEMYRATREAEWLEAARICADHLLGWQYSYDVVFPEGSICALQKVSTWGTAPASVRNRHIQNWETVALSTLCELSDWTGDALYAERAKVLLHQSCQMVERGSGALGIPLGSQSEQWYATEMRTFGDHGDYGKGNMWKMSVCLPKAGFLNTLAKVPAFSIAEAIC